MSINTDAINVIHVDDNSDITEMATIYLEHKDDRINVQTAGSVDEGLDKAIQL